MRNELQKKSELALFNLTIDSKLCCCGPAQLQIGKKTQDFSEQMTFTHNVRTQLGRD